MKARQEQLQQTIAGAAVVSVAVFFVTYVLVTALSLPSAAVMAIAGGALFGLIAGTVIVFFASTLGATLAFLSSRFLFRESLRKRYDKKVQRVDEWIAVDGLFYLASLRLVPAFPFFVINIVMELTGIRICEFLLGESVGHASRYSCLCECGYPLSGDPKGRRHLVAPAAFLFPVVGSISSDRQIFISVFQTCPAL